MDRYRAVCEEPTDEEHSHSWQRDEDMSVSEANRIRLQPLPSLEGAGNGRAATPLKRQLLWRLNSMAVSGPDQGRQEARGETIVTLPASPACPGSHHREWPGESRRELDEKRLGVVDVRGTCLPGETSPIGSRTRAFCSRAIEPQGRTALHIFSGPDLSGHSSRSSSAINGARSIRSALQPTIMIPRDRSNKSHGPRMDMNVPSCFSNVNT
jgi:hypothetical protein